MNEIYWLIIVLDNLKSLVEVTLILLLILGAFVVLRFLGSDNQSWDKDFSNFFKKHLLITGILGIVFCFLPSKQDMLTIYGIGDNEVKELPDKASTTLSEYSDNTKDQEDGKN